MFVLVAHFRLSSSGADPIPASARRPLELLAESPECGRLHFARSTDVADRFVLVAEFESAAAYRRALAPWQMRIEVIPWLSTAEPESTVVSEVLFSFDGGQILRSEPTVPNPGR